MWGGPPPAPGAYGPILLRRCVVRGMRALGAISPSKFCRPSSVPIPLLASFECQQAAPARPHVRMQSPFWRALCANIGSCVKPARGRMARTERGLASGTELAASHDRISGAFHGSKGNLQHFCDRSESSASKSPPSISTLDAPAASRSFWDSLVTTSTPTIHISVPCP
jgi:hypothetical protein